MLNRYFGNAGFFFAFLFPSFLCLFLERDFLWDNVSYLYLSQLIALLIFLKKEKSFIVVLHPILLSLLYILVSFSIGSWAFSEELVYKISDLQDAQNWLYFEYSSFYILLMNTVLFGFFLILRSGFESASAKKNHVQVDDGHNRVKVLLVSAILILLPFLFFDIDLSIIGGSGGVSIIPKSILTLSVIYYLAVRRIKYRFLIYAMLLICFAFFSSNDKRDAIFLVFPMLLLESVFNDFNWDYKTTLSLFMLLCLLFILIVLMSISRGYGGYEVNSFIDSLSFFSTYITSDFFLVSFLNNIEVNYTYFHTLQAMDFILDDSDLLLYGSSIIKFLFLIFPRDIFWFKPDSFIDVYTMKYDPAFRAVGGSWPPNFYAELYWNFSFLSFLLSPIVFYILHRMYVRAIKNISIISYSWSLFYIYFVYIFLTLIRGSGFDLLAFNMIVCFIFCFFIYIFIAFFGRRLR